MTQTNNATQAVTALQAVILAAGTDAVTKATAITDAIIPTVFTAMLAERNIPALPGVNLETQSAILANLYGEPVMHERIAAALLPALQAFAATLPAAATSEPTAAESNGKLYTEAEMNALIGAAVDAKMNEFLRQMSQQQTPVTPVVTPAAPAQTAFTPIPYKAVGAWEYTRVATAQGLRTGGDFTEQVFQAFGDALQAGMYGLGSLAKTGAHMAADFVDVAPQNRTNAQAATQPAAQWSIFPTGQRVAK